MSGLGVHFALSAEDVAALLAQPDDDARLTLLHEDIEDRYFEEPLHLAESDKSWDAMHRALGDGKLDGETGPYPLSHVVLGGQQLYDGDDYILALKDPKMVHDIAQALASVTKERLRAGYDAMDAKAYGFEPSDEDFEYTWGWFEDVRTLYYTADRLGRHVLFSADQ